MDKRGQIGTGAIIAIVSVIVLLFAGIGTYLIVSNVGTTQSGIIPASCLVEDTNFDFGDFLCPSGAALCDITVTLECENQVSEPKVSFRTSAPVDGLKDSYKSQWIVVDKDGDGDLESFEYTGSQGGGTAVCSESRVGFVGRTPDGFCLRSSGDRIALYYDSNSFLNFEAGGSGDLTPTPLEPYASRGQEQYAGNEQAYQCSQEVTGDKSLTVSYAGVSAGQTTKTFTIDGGERILWDGRIDHTISTTLQSQCQQSTQGSTPNSFFECSVDNNGCGVLATSETFCDGDLIFNENQQECTVPYTLDLNLNKQVYAVSEKIEGTIELKNTDDRAFIEITVSLLDVLDNEKSFTIVSTNSRGKAIFTLPSQNLVGDYKVVAEANHPDGTIPITQGISVAQPITVRVAAFPDQIQFNSEPIQAKVFVTDDQGNAEDAKSWDLEGTKCGSSDVSRDVQIQRLGRTSQGTEYLFSTSVSNECTFVYKVVAIDDSGFRSQASSTSITVKASEILIKADLTGVQDKDAGRRTVSFRTLGSDLQPVSTSNLVVITDSDGCDSGQFCLADNEVLPAVQVSGSDGDYAFTYNYKDGLTTIQITSSASGIQSTQQDFIVNLFPSSTQDPIGGDTGGTSTGVIFGLSIGFIITLLLVLLAFGAFVYFVFIRK